MGGCKFDCEGKSPAHSSTHLSQWIWESKYFNSIEHHFNVYVYIVLIDHRTISIFFHKYLTLIKRSYIRVILKLLIVLRDFLVFSLVSLDVYFLSRFISDRMMWKAVAIKKNICKIISHQSSFFFFAMPALDWVFCSNFSWIFFGFKWLFYVKRLQGF